MTLLTQCLPSWNTKREILWKWRWDNKNASSCSASCEMLRNCQQKTVDKNSSLVGRIYGKVSVCRWVQVRLLEGVLKVQKKKRKTHRRTKCVCLRVMKRREKVKSGLSVCANTLCSHTYRLCCCRGQRRETVLQRTHVAGQRRQCVRRQRTSDDHCNSKNVLRLPLLAKATQATQARCRGLPSLLTSGNLLSIFIYWYFALIKFINDLLSLSVLY